MIPYLTIPASVQSADCRKTEEFMRTMKLRGMIVAAVSLLAFIVMTALFVQDVYADEMLESDMNVLENTTKNDRLLVKANSTVKINIAEGVTLTCNKGIGVPEGASLTIEGGGTLIATGPDYCAGIGGTGNSYDTPSPSGKITINGCTVQATGGKFAAGIGSGPNGKAGDITIIDSNVTAKSGTDGGAGIGGGYTGDAGKIVIERSVVDATGSKNSDKGGAGIGSGAFASAYDISIIDSIVTARGGFNAAGIGEGGSDNPTNGKIEIIGGRISAVSSGHSESSVRNDAGIGASASGKGGGTISLSWTKETDYIDTPCFIGEVTLERDFVFGDDIVPAGKLTDNASINGKKITPELINIESLYQWKETSVGWNVVEGAAKYRVQAIYKKGESSASSEVIETEGPGKNVCDFEDFIKNKKDGTYTVYVWAYDTDNKLIGYGVIGPTEFYEIKIEKKSLDEKGIPANESGGNISFSLNGGGGLVLENDNGSETMYRPAGNAEVSWSAESKKGFLINSFTVNGETRSGNRISFELDNNLDIKAVFKKTNEIKTAKLEMGHASTVQTALEKVKAGNECSIHDESATSEGSIITVYINKAWTNNDIQDEFRNAIFDAYGANGFIDIDSKDRLSSTDLAGLKPLTEYASQDAYKKDSEDSSLVVANDGAIFYAPWYRPVSSVSLAISNPVCGTAVATTQVDSEDGPEITQTNAPIVAASEHAEIVPNSTYWISSVQHGFDVDYLNSTINGGDSYKFKMNILPRFGYYFADGIENRIIINKKNAERVTASPVGAIVIGNVTAVHDYVNGACSACGKRDPDYDPGHRPSPLNPGNKDVSTISIEPYTVTYNGTAVNLPAPIVNGSTGSVTISFYDAHGKELKAATVNAGTYYAVAYVSADDKYAAAVSEKVKVTVKKAANPMKAKAKKKSFKVKAKKKTAIAKKKAFKITGNKGKVTFKKVKGNKRIRVSKTGKITIRKGLKKDKTYILKVRVRAAGNSNYRANSRTLILKFKTVK